MRISTLFTLCLFSVIVAGCSDSPEQVAARKIFQKVAKAREFMSDGTEGSYGKAGSLLQEALKTPNATLVAKRPANELLGALLSQSTAIRLAQFDDKQSQFTQADADLRLTFRKLSIQAATYAQATGFKTIDHWRLLEYRRQLLEEISKAEGAADAAVLARSKAEMKLDQTRNAADTAALTAESLLTKAEDFSGDEYVEQVKTGAELRIDADFLRIQARDEELVLVSARQAETQKKAVLLGLQAVLQSTEQLIAEHKTAVGQNESESVRAELDAQNSAGELIEQLEKFVNLGEELSGEYQELVDTQGRAVSHFDQALRAATKRREKFSSYQARVSADTPKDQRVQTLSGPADEIALAVNLARAKLSLAQLRGRQEGVLQRAVARIQQMEEARKDLARFGEPVASAVPAESRTQPDTQEPSGGFGFFGRLLTKSEKTPRVQKPTTAEGIIIGAPQADSAEIAENISRIREAGLTDLESAIDAVWSATMSRQKRETPEQDAEEAVEALNGQKEWNWQVWSMLGLAHQQRAALHGQMNKLAEASEDLSASRAYFAAARKARPDVFRSTVSN